MERLTTRTSVMGRKHDIAYGCASIWKKKLKNDKYELIENVVDKLGQLENIEEELGIDLITLFKALTKKRGFLFKSKKRKQWVVNPTGYDITLKPEEFAYYVEKGIFESKKNCRR